MALERHVIELSAKDNVSAALKHIGATAEQTGTKVVAANQKAAKSSQDWSQEAKILGGILGGVLAGGMALSIRSASNLNESISKSSVVFGDSAAEIRHWASDAAQSMGLSEQAALEASGTFGNLFKTMGLGESAAADLSKDVVGLAADLASFNNIGVDDALEKLRAGLVGEVEPLRALGINLSEAAVEAELARQGIEKTNGAFTDAQKITARYSLIMAQSGSAQGDFARTSDGMANQMRIARAEFDNAAAALGTALLPAATQGIHIISELAEGFSKLPGPLQTGAAGLGTVSAGLLLIGPPAKKAYDAIHDLSASMGGLTSSSFLGPVGLVAALGIATVAGYKWIDGLEDGQVTAEGVADAVGDLNTSLAQLGQQGVSTDILQILASEADAYQTLGTNLDAYNTQLGQVIARENELKLERANTGSIDRIKEIDAELASLDGVRQNLESVIISQDKYNAIQTDSIHLLTHLGDLNKNVIIARFEELWQQFDAGEINATELADGIKYLDENSATYGLTLEEISHQQQAATDTQDKYATSVADLTKTFTMIRPEIVAVDDSLVGFIEKTTWSAEEMRELSENAEDAVTGLGGFAKGADSTTTASYQLAGAVADLGQKLQDDIPGQAGRAYDSIVGYTDGLVGAIQKTKEWSDSLTAPLGGDYQPNGDPSKLIQLMADGKLDVEDYNEALDAQTRIYGDLARAQDAAAIIQIKQAGAIADGADATADYLEQLSKLPESEQEVKLAWADTDIAGRATEIADLADNYDTMGESSQNAFKQMVEGAANSDPQLAAVLDNLDLIQKKADGTYELKVPADQAQSDTQLLIDALETLGAIILGIPDIDVAATLHTGGFWDVYNSLPKDATIDVYYAYHGSIPQLALGGTIPWEGDTAAMGRLSAGNMTLVGEHGPELVSLPGGSMVTPNHASQYMNKGRGGGDLIIQNMTVVANDPHSFMRQMRSYETTMERR